ncbi:MAG TPA: 2-dehydro-3-deoxy-6-phosphogalactonate aldolase [Steroidobacteraceae bacterium]|nr:2-dehydro-3-deoxy-6-phosphogalactonate aldolase [Steroidobacteraceae bacterium]
MTAMQTSSSLVAILRGIVPEQAEHVAITLHRNGIRMMEVTLNSPDPFRSMAIIARLQLQDCVVGAGTVLNVDDVQRTHDTGGQLIVTPNCDVAVIQHALKLGMLTLPGIATATEAFTAIHAGATQLKLFPAITYGCVHLKALKAVLPHHIRIFPVGGIGAADVDLWVKSGANGFGFGSELFKPEYSLSDIESRARQLVQCCTAAGLVV